MTGQHRQDVRAGVEVNIILKEDQASGKLTRGVVKEVLTRSSFHPHGIKVRLASGEVGRVQAVFDRADGE
ncbi:MAG TPA: YwbE family protein [Blastocatellia bacterium]|nr:YwbE family protein [Blastocatellia bacterium]